MWSASVIVRGVHTRTGRKEEIFKKQENTTVNISHKLQTGKGYSESKAVPASTFDAQWWVFGCFFFPFVDAFDFLAEG